MLLLLDCVGPQCPGDLVPEPRQRLCQHQAELLLAGKAEEQLGKRGFSKECIPALAVWFWLRLGLWP